MEFSPPVAIFMTLFAAMLWGSWFQAVKFLKGYPIAGYMLWLYMSSFVLVWGVTFALAPKLLPEGLVAAMQGKMGLIILMLVCGAAMASGLQVQLSIMGKIGLILPNSIASILGIFLGTAVTAIVGKLPPNLSVGMLIVAAVVLLAASIICQYSGVLRDREHKRLKRKSEPMQAKYILLVVLSSVLTTAYMYGMAKGVQTDLNPTGLPPLLCVAVLATGSFVGTVIHSAILLTIRKEWKQLFGPRAKVGIAMGCISGLCHYGGNILNILATPTVSVAVAYLMGRTSSMWTYLWGIVYGEYRKAGRKAYLTLGAGVLLYIGGVLLLAYALYR